MTHLDPDLDRLGDALRASAAIDLSEQAPDGRSVPTASRRRLRAPAFAGGTLGLAGIGVAAVLAFSGGAAAPALAVTQQSDGSVLVTVNVDETTQPWVQAADQKLAAMGIDESIQVQTAPGAASSSAPVACQPGLAAAERVGSALKPVTVGTASGPPIKVELGSDGTDVIPSGSTGAGTVHLASCHYFNTPAPGANTGNSGS